MYIHVRFTGVFCLFETVICKVDKINIKNELLVDKSSFFLFIYDYILSIQQYFNCV